MRQTLKNPLALFCLFSIAYVGTPLRSNSLHAADEPRYLLPPGQTAPATPTGPQRSTYESLTEPRGTPKLRQDRKAQEQRAADEEAKAQDATPDIETEKPSARSEEPESPIINFNNVSITEVLKYVSRLTGKNFVYDPQELQFTITMISDSPNSIEEVLAMVLQSLRVHGFSILEEGGAYIINTSPTVRVAGALEKKGEGIAGPQIATQVFVLQNLPSDQCAAIIKTMVTDGAVVETIGDSSVIVTDVTTNLNRIALVVKKMDAQVGGLEIGQYVAINSSPTALVTLAERVLAPLTINKPLVLVPHTSSNSVFIVSTQFLIEKTLSIMQSIDLNLAQSGLLNDLKFDPETAERAQRLKALEEAQRNSLKEIEGLSEEEIKQRLMEQGAASVDELDRMSANAARELLRRIMRRRLSEEKLPVGTVEATQFLIYRLQYRKSTDMVTALKAIASSLTGEMPGANPLQPQIPINPELSQSDLIITLNSMQAIEDNNSIVFTGTPASLEKIKGLLRQLDIPVRQVFIEALFLDTTLTNSLQFDVEWAAKIQRSNLGAQVGFLAPTLPAFQNSFNAIQQTSPAQVPPPAAPGGLSAGELSR